MGATRACRLHRRLRVGVRECGALPMFCLAYCVLAQKKTECIITQGTVRTNMTRIVQSFSVPDGSVAHAKLKQWKQDGSNISSIIQMLLEVDEMTHVTHVRSLRKKILRLKELTKDGRRFTLEEWEDEFSITELWKE